MRLIESDKEYSPLFIDFISRYSKIKEIAIGEKSVFIGNRYYNRIYKKYYSEIMKGTKRFKREIDELMTLYKKTLLNFKDLKEAIEFPKKQFEKYFDISIMFHAMTDAIVDSIKVDAKDKYRYYYILSKPLELSFEESAKKSILEIGLLIEKNKTLKKSFNSSPEKIMDKINTFYINIYNNIMSYKKNYSWIKTSFNSYEDYDIFDIIRDLKVLIRDTNIKREYQDIVEHKTLIKKSFNRIRKKLTKKAISISDISRKIALLNKYKDEFMRLYIYSLISLFPKRDNILNHNIKSLYDIYNGKIIKEAKVRKFRDISNKTITKREFDKIKKRSEYHCITNFDITIKGNTKDMIFVKDFSNNIDFEKLNNSKCIILDCYPSIFSYYYKYTKNKNMAFGAGILSTFKNIDIKIENNKIRIL